MCLCLVPFFSKCIFSCYTIPLHRPAILFLVFLFLFSLPSLQTPLPLPVCYLPLPVCYLPLYRCAPINLISLLDSLYDVSLATHSFLISSFVIFCHLTFRILL